MNEELQNLNNIHLENVFEKHIVKCLVKEQEYIERNCLKNYDVSLAIDKEVLIRFIKETQPKEWKSLLEYYKNSAESEIFKRLEQTLRNQSTYKVLRNGIKLVPNIIAHTCK